MYNNKERGLVAHWLHCIGVQ